jgi:hypothetical protein
MNNILKIFLFVVLLIFIVERSFALGEVQQADTVKIKQKETGSSVKKDEKNSDSGKNKRKALDQNTGNTGIKQVKGARPDMSKARGARPPDIERPSGSRIPKGVGRPGGAIRPGKL